MRGRGWKYGSGFVDGIFPVLSPTGQRILEFVQRQENNGEEIIWSSLDSLPASLSNWDEIVNVAVQLRIRKHWDSIISVRKLFQFFFSIFILVINFIFGPPMVGYGI